jgi:nickel/cobalt exporter
MIARRSRFVTGLTIAVVIVLAFAALDTALAQPFGMSRGGGTAAPSFGPVMGWILEKQAEFYRMLSGAIRAAKADGSAAWTLMGISFVYGVFHAAGPGHGKAVISSYLVAKCCRLPRRSCRPSPPSPSSASPPCCSALPQK